MWRLTSSFRRHFGVNVILIHYPHPNPFLDSLRLSQAVPQDLAQNSIETVGTKPSILEEGTYLWDADNLHKSSKASSQSASVKQTVRSGGSPSKVSYE